MDKEQIHILIDRYFEGDTTLQEEKRLRDNLPVLAGESVEIDEALAVMGYAARPAKKAPSTGNTGRRYKMIMTAAASLALLLAAGGIYHHFSNEDRHNTFMAYSGGVKLDRQETMKLIAAQMEEMSDASQSVRDEVEDDLADFRSAFD